MVYVASLDYIINIIRTPLSFSFLTQSYFFIINTSIFVLSYETSLQKIKGPSIAEASFHKSFKSSKMIKQAYLPFIIISL